MMNIGKANIAPSENQARSPKQVSIYNGFAEDLFVVFTFRAESGIGIGVSAL